VRFDGVRFTVFDKSNTKGLSTKRFTALYEDKDGTLWIGTGDGGLTFYRDGVFKSLTVKDGVPCDAELKAIFASTSGRTSRENTPLKMLRARGPTSITFGGAPWSSRA